MFAQTEGEAVAMKISFDEDGEQNENRQEMSLAARLAQGKKGPSKEKGTTKYPTYR